MPRRRPNPIAWIALAVAVLLLTVMIKAVGGGDSWQPKAVQLAQNQAKLGREVAALRTQLKSLDRLELFRRMRAWQRQASADLAGARELAPPKEGRVQNGYLIAAIGLRAGALRRFDPAVRNALSDTDLQVAQSQLINVMEDLLLADRSYELFRTSWRKDGGAKPPASQWIADEEDASPQGVGDFVRELRKQAPLKAIYNLAVVSVTIDPKPVGKDGDRDAIPFTKSLAVAVVIENTGNQRIAATTVSAVLISETDPEPKTVEGHVGSMAPKDRKSITLNGLDPAPGVLNLLRVTVGPVGEELNTIDNVREYPFLMRKP